MRAIERRIDEIELGVEKDNKIAIEFYNSRSKSRCSSSI